MAAFMSYDAPAPIIDALTRSTVRRDEAGLIGSDEDLLHRLDAHLDPRQIELLAATSRVLRLMDGLLSGAETGEGFVEKFSSLWAGLKRAYTHDLEDRAQQLDQFYGDIQLFCASDRDRREEALLFGIDRLKALTQPVYADLKQWWCEHLTNPTVSQMRS